jgi:hypothetical protein
MYDVNVCKGTIPCSCMNTIHCIALREAIHREEENIKMESEKKIKKILGRVEKGPFLYFFFLLYGRFP